MLYNNENLNSILDKLRSLEPWELEIVISEIHAIQKAITKKTVTNFVITPPPLPQTSNLERLLKCSETALFVFNSFAKESIHSNSLEISQLHSIRKTYHELVDQWKSSLISSSFDRESKISESAEVTMINETLNKDLEANKTVKKAQRPLGIWKGKVEISEDFYKTSSDILSELGIEE